MSVRLTYIKKTVVWMLAAMLAFAAPMGVLAGEVNSSSNEMINVLNEEEVETGFVTMNGVISSTATLAYTKRIPVEEGDTFTMWYFGTSAASTSFRCVTAYDENGRVILSAGAESKKSYTVPAGVSSLVFTVSKESLSKSMIIKNSLTAPDRYIAYNDDSERMEVPKGEHLTNLFDPSAALAGYMAPSGGVSSLSSLCYTEKLSVEEGDVLYLWKGSAPYSPRFITAFDADGKAVTASGSSSPSAVYTVPEGISSVVFTVYTSAKDTLMIIKNDDTVPPVYIPYGKAPEDTDDGDDEPAISYGPEYLTASGDMGIDTTLSAGKADIITDKHLVFTADVDSFEGLRIGHGHKAYTGNYVEIDKNSIRQYFYTSGASLQKEAAHGMEIKGDIKVTIDVNARRVATVTLESGGESFIFKTSTTWYGSNGEIFATSMGSVLKDAQLAFTCDGYSDDIQFYGDSYLSQSSDRWLYFAFNDGYTDALFDGYGGRGSGGAYASLVENLKHSDPETVVWMMGMNDGTDADADTPSSTWASNRDKLIALSEKEGFEIVFATIPTVPRFNHEAKNKWIKESGYRYIDMAAAVGADGTGAWTEGMLNSDNVHPTASGAKAIYQQVIKDFPDFTGDVTAQNGIFKYADLADALESAKDGDTVKMIDDAVMRYAHVPENVTLDLNGHELEADYLASFGDIIDSSEANTGMLDTASGHILMQKDNGALPVKDDEGYRFYKMRDFKDAVSDGDDLAYMFLPYFDLDSHALLLRGSKATGVTVNARAVWGSDIIKTQKFVYSDEMVKKLITGYDTTKPGTYADMFTLRIKNAGAYENLEIKAVIMSELGVEIPIR